MQGPIIAAIVAVIAWLGLAAYLKLLGARLAEATASLEHETRHGAPRVEVVEVKADGQQ